MYIIIRPAVADIKETLCLVKAASAEHAKRLAGVPPGHFRWLFIRDDLFMGLQDVKECLIEYEF